MDDSLIGGGLWTVSALHLVYGLLDVEVADLITDFPQLLGRGFGLSQVEQINLVRLLFLLLVQGVQKAAVELQREAVFCLVGRKLNKGLGLVKLIEDLPWRRGRSAIGSWRKIMAVVGWLWIGDGVKVERRYFEW